MKISNNKIQITDGANGIGLGLIEGFIAENNTVIVCSKLGDLLNELSEKFQQVITKQFNWSVAEKTWCLYGG